MIANLITTILLALGVVSGTQATSNTFYKENKTKPIQKAIETINDTINFTDTNQVNQDIVINSNGTTDLHTIRKYYLDSNSNPNCYKTYLNIYNTAYSNYKVHEFTDWGTKQVECITYFLFTVNNYYDSVLTYKLSVENQVNAITNGYEYQDVYITNEDINNYIDMSLTNNTRETLNTYINSISNDNVFTYGNGVTTPSSNTYTTETQTPQITLRPHEQAHIVMKIRIQYEMTNNVTVLNNKPTTLKIEGQLIIPENSIEIIDVPNLMFTILTMPFAWYSTAFNLTIFPGTPYALNFGNLILTMVAALTLLYIIKKILK